jgi:hypothetical protein
MAESRGQGDERGNRSGQGQQSGSNRPRGLGGAAKPAPKKGGVPPKGMARDGASAKSAPGKSGVAERAGKKPSSERGR